MNAKFEKLMLEKDSGDQHEIENKERYIAQLKIDFNERIDTLNKEILQLKKQGRKKDDASSMSGKKMKDLEKELKKAREMHAKEI